MPQAIRIGTRDRSHVVNLAVLQCRDRHRGVRKDAKHETIHARQPTTEIVGIAFEDDVAARRVTDEAKRPSANRPPGRLAGEEILPLILMSRDDGGFDDVQALE